MDMYLNTHNDKNLWIATYAPGVYGWNEIN